MKYLLVSLTVLFLFSACKKEEPGVDDGPYLEFKFKFDATQERLGPFGQPSSVPSNHAAQTPNFNGMSAHFIELVPTQLTPYQGGQQAYMGAETNAGGAKAIDFSNAIVSDEGEVWHRVPLKEITPGTYNHIRVSVAYQNYDVKYNILNVPVVGDVNNQNGTCASFVGYNTYIETLTPNAMNLDVNDDKLQGFWAFETDLSSPLETYNQIVSGEAPAGATTVVNPFNVPIPVGSCVVGGSLTEPFVVTGDETADRTITLSFSTNQSFEWVDSNGNGEWDLDASGASLESVVDMGLRGLKGIVD